MRPAIHVISNQQHLFTFFSKDTIQKKLTHMYFIFFYHIDSDATYNPLHFYRVGAWRHRNIFCLKPALS